MPIVMACMSMSRGKVGALIVIERGVKLEDIVETGDLIDARIDQLLLKTSSLRILHSMTVRWLSLNVVSRLQVVFFL